MTSATSKIAVFIAMEFIEGGTLSLSAPPAGAQLARNLDGLPAAGRGLQHAHVANLVHRDFNQTM